VQIQKAPRHFKIPSVASADWDSVEKRGARLSSFIQLNGAAYAKEPTVAFLAYDQQDLLISMRCLGRPSSQLVAALKDRDSGIWAEDSVEVFIDPLNDHYHYDHFILNPLNTLLDEKCKMGAEMDVSWNPVIDTQTQLQPGFWTARFKIPFSILGKTPKRGETWGLNLVRNHRTETHSVSLFSHASNPHDAEAFAQMIFE
jgi:hypothetical protein